MQAIIFRKIGNEPEPFSVGDWERERILYHFNESFRDGTIIILKKTAFAELAAHVNLGHLINCGIKQPKIELFRALKFHQLGKNDSPRRIIAEFSSAGAFKRSFFRFFKDHYKSASPPCLLFITNNIMDELETWVRDQVKKPVSRDPVSLLLSGIPQGETMEKMSRVYIGESLVARITRVMIYKASQAVSPVLVLGESGTGKELIARLVFEYSKKYKKGFYAINCSSIPDSLLESELFGHKKGSFTDAREDKEGLFEAAHEGTLFLDEIGDLSLPNQAKLLRAIEEGEIRSVGATVTKKVDLRIIAATNRNLASMMKQKTFREDLYYRLNSLIIIAPPLREHPEDIPVIASAIRAKLEQQGKLSTEFLDYLKGYSWPGNVRELKTMLQSISDLFEGISPGPEHIEAIRAYHRKILIESAAVSEGESHSLLKAQSRNRIIEVQYILRGIKIELRPIINKQLPDDEPKMLDKLRQYLSVEVDKLEELCREPILFKDRMLFDHIKRFRYLIQKNLMHWTGSADDLRTLWHTELNPLHENIDQEIFDMIWEKKDL